MTTSHVCGSACHLNLNLAEGILRCLPVRATTVATPNSLINPVRQSISSRHQRILPLEQQLGNRLGAAQLSSGHLRKSQQAWSKRRSSVEYRLTSADANGVLTPANFGGDRCWHTSLNQPSRTCRRSFLQMATLKRDQVGPGQESVWDYPRPPRMELFPEKIKIVFNGETVAETTGAYRILETSHAPVYYIPTADIKMEYITLVAGSSFCEWKGSATWWTVTVGAKVAEKAAWSYEQPSSAYLPIKGYLAFYASPMDACFVGEEKAQPQPGNFYGGWVTSKVVGPFKGGPGSWGW